MGERLAGTAVVDSLPRLLRRQRTRQKMNRRCRWLLSDPSPRPSFNARQLPWPVLC